MKHLVQLVFFLFIKKDLLTGYASSVGMRHDTTLHLLVHIVTQTSYLPITKEVKPDDVDTVKNLVRESIFLLFLFTPPA